MILEASDQLAGAWPHYYDSLTLFSPARFSAFPDAPFAGDCDRYPRRDEVVDYLTRYAERLGVEIRTNTRVEAVEKADGAFVVRTADGRTLTSVGIVAATGASGNPVRPAFPGQEGFTGELLHVADYREPKAYAGKRVVVVAAATQPSRSATNSR
ncbi:FAD-dependent oxidoreductase [Streptomyces sp. NPDC015127]|uniref:FAD-dependent oxidoreductase n=1 Tax=Streptomyces sp. NPDC015127 TaxID=3364939 RepID=UPI0037008150